MRVEEEGGGGNLEMKKEIFAKRKYAGGLLRRKMENFAQ